MAKDFTAVKKKFAKTWNVKRFSSGLVGVLSVYVAVNITEIRKKRWMMYLRAFMFLEYSHQR